MVRVPVALLALPASLASGGQEPSGIPWAALGWHAFNLALLLGLVFWLARRPVSDALKNRATGVRRAIEGAQAERDQARAQLEELEEKLAEFELQVERLRKDTAAQAQHEREALIERARREAEVVRLTAERAIREETRRARRELQEQSVTLAVALAERILAHQASEADQQALAQQLLDAVGASERGAGSDHGA